MKKEHLISLMNKDSWYSIQLKNGFHYKCKLIELCDDSLTVLDKFGLVSVFNLNSIVYISAWKDKLNQK